MLIYIADPMCSWCYGFGPELDALLARFPAQPLRLVMGGLRAYNTRALDEPARRSILHHWEEVRRASGLPFDTALLARDGFTYDTEPACRAVVTARTHAPGLAWPLLRGLQHAFYAQARDITREAVLTEVYAETCAAADRSPRHEGAATLAAQDFARALASDAMKQATHADFRLVREWEVHGFPALFAERGGHFARLAAGYTKADAAGEHAQRFFNDADRSP